MEITVDIKAPEVAKAFREALRAIERADSDAQDACWAVDRLTAIRAAFERTAGMNGSNTTWMVRAIAAEDAADRLTAISALLWAEHKALTSVDLALEALPKGITLSLYEAYHDDWRSAHAAAERLKEAHDEA